MFFLGFFLFSCVYSDRFMLPSARGLHDGWAVEGTYLLLCPCVAVEFRDGADAEAAVPSWRITLRPELVGEENGRGRKEAPTEGGGRDWRDEVGDEVGGRRLVWGESGEEEDSGGGRLVG